MLPAGETGCRRLFQCQFSGTKFHFPALAQTCRVCRGFLSACLTLTQFGKTLSALISLPMEQLQQTLRYPKPDQTLHQGKATALERNYNPIRAAGGKTQATSRRLHQSRCPIWINKADCLAIFRFDCLKNHCITDLSHGSRTGRLTSTMNREHNRCSSRGGILAPKAALCKSSLHSLRVILPTGGRGGLASTQMHAGIVFLFILSLPCRHVLFFFSLFPPRFPSAFRVPVSPVCLRVNILSAASLCAQR